jgi:hypothetical protein
MRLHGFGGARGTSDTQAGHIIGQAVPLELGADFFARRWYGCMTQKPRRAWLTHKRWRC